MTELEELICRSTSASSCELGDVIQTLWSGYGAIHRASLELHGQEMSVIVKHVDISESRENRRGWSGDISHRRKVHSYEVETAFYETYASRCSERCPVPSLVGAREKEDGAGWIIVMTDLDAAGFDVRKSTVSKRDIQSCLRWLANFHGTFLHQVPEGLWPVGTYWHLETRPEELEIMERGPLKDAAAKIDERLNTAQFQTLVHGDAKLANFCFGSDSRRHESVSVAAVDFQYVGGGCGMKDVAYFISSCLNESDSESQQHALLDFYFQELELSLRDRPGDFAWPELEKEWRNLYAFAWADFCRFLAGWSPGHWKLNSYNDRVTQQVLDSLR